MSKKKQAASRPQPARSQGSDGNGGAVVAPKSPDPATPTATTIDADKSTWLERMDLLRRLLRDHLPPVNRARYEFETEIAEQRCLNGDVDDGPDLNEVKAAFAAFRAIPLEQQKYVLNGWHPDVLDTDRGAKARYERQAPLFPVLMMDASPGESILQRPICQFDEIAGDAGATCTLYILAGSTKGEAMTALETLTHWVDHFWDDLITDPLRRAARGRDGDE